MRFEYMASWDVIRSLKLLLNLIANYDRHLHIYIFGEPGHFSSIIYYLYLYITFLFIVFEKVLCILRTLIILMS